MNPALKVITSKALAQAKDKTGNALANTNVRNAIGIVILGAGSYFLGRKIWHNWQEKKAGRRTNTSIYSQQAAIIYDATRMFSRNSTLLMNLARQGIDAKKVDNEYVKHYGHSLHEDVRKSLSQDDYSTFLTLLRTVQPSSKSAPAVTTSKYSDSNIYGQYARLKSKTKLYKDIDGIPWKVKTGEAGKLIKYPMNGKVHLRGLLGKEIKFYEIRVVTEDGKKIHSIYVNSEDIQVVPKGTKGVLIKFYDEEF